MFFFKSILILIIFIVTEENTLSIETVAVDEGVIPLMYKVNGEARGLYPVLIKEIFNRMEVSLEIKALPWKRALFYADSGLMGIAGVYKTEERLKKYDFSDELFNEVIVIYTLIDEQFEYKEINDLLGKKIGIIRGWSYGEEFDLYSSKKLFKVEEVSTDEQNFKKLFNKRLDCFLIVKEAGELILKRNPIFKKSMISLKKVFLVNPTYLIFPKSLNKVELLNKFNDELMKLKKSDKYNRLIKIGMSD